VTRSSTTNTRPTGPGARCATSDEQVAEAEKAVAGRVPVRRPREPRSALPLSVEMW